MAGAAPSTGRRWRNLHPAREYDVRRGRGLWVLLLGMVAAAAPIIGYLVQQNSYVQVRYRIEELRRRQGELREQERRLRIEKAALEALPRVEAVAGERLGLTRARPEQVVVLGRRPPGRAAP